MIIQSLPVIRDPRELQTILTYSLRDLFGELETHSFSVEVKASTQQHYSNNNSSESNNKDAAIVMMIVECPSESAKQVRAAMTMCTPPPYLQDTHFRLDVMDLETFQKVR